MEFKQKEALRYLRAKPGDKAAEILVDTVYLKLRNEVQARYVLQKHAITADEAGVTLDCGVRFHSRALALHLKGCDTVLLMGATLLCLQKQRRKWRKKTALCLMYGFCPSRRQKTKEMMSNAVSKNLS